jgi:D-threo-aldose 1-dehydrogenase
MNSRSIASSGLRLTELGLGCAPIAGLYRACSEDMAWRTFDAAWDCGIRYFDTAPFYGYGLSENRTGAFLRTKQRDDLVLSTKVGRLLRPASAKDGGGSIFAGAPVCAIDFDYSRDGILRSVEASLTRTGLDRFDILYVHDIGVFAHGVEGNAFHLQQFRASGIAAMDELRDSGVIKAWGLGVNEVEVCLDVLDSADLDVILLAGRYTLLDRRAEERLLGLCAERGTSLVIGGVFNSGILATGPVPGAYFDYVEANADIAGRVRAIDALAAEHDVRLAEAALQFPLRNSAVSSVLVGAADPEIVRQNVAALSVPIDPALYEACRPFVLQAG